MWNCVHVLAHAALKTLLLWTITDYLHPFTILNKSSEKAIDLRWPLTVHRSRFRVRTRQRMIKKWIFCSGTRSGNKNMEHRIRCDWAVCVIYIYILCRCVFVYIVIWTNLCWRRFGRKWQCILAWFTAYYGLFCQELWRWKTASQIEYDTEGMIMSF